MVPTAVDLLAAYDAQLRGVPEVRGAMRIVEVGPAVVAVFPGGRGFVTHVPLSGVDAAGARSLVRQAVEVLRADPDVRTAEWKTRGHDRTPGPPDALVDTGFVAQAPRRS